jgi:predicted ATPase
VLRRIPEGVKEVIGTRLNRLSPGCNAVLANAAAIGRTFNEEVLAALLDTESEDALAGALEEALAAAVIEPAVEPRCYQFSHALVRETLYDEIPPTRRARDAAWSRSDVEPRCPRAPLLRGPARR